MSASKDEVTEILLCQLQECWEHIRHWSALIWQIPVTSMAINTFLGIVYFESADFFWGRFLALLASAAYTLVSLFALIKFRVLSIARNEDSEWIQDKLRQRFKDIRMLKFRTRDILKGDYKRVGRTWWHKQSAYIWFRDLLFLTFSFYVIMLIVEVLTEIMRCN